jgi:hypothetical protein
VQGLPEEDTNKTGVCPICDSKVDLDATKCPECKADLSVFGVKVDGEEDADVSLSEVGDSLEKLLGEIGKKDDNKERELFDEIMAAVDTTDLPPEEAEAAEAAAQAAAPQAEALPEQAPAAEAPVEEAPPAEGPVMFECPLCNTLVDETASACPGCGAIFAQPEAEAPAETAAEEGVASESAAAAEPEMAPEEPAAEEPVAFEEAPALEAEEEPAPAEPVAEEEKKKFKFGTKKKREKPPPPPAKKPIAVEKVVEKKVEKKIDKKDDKALHRELAECVADVKPLLAGARRMGINVFEGRKRIDQAIAAGKKRDFISAIALVKESQKTIEGAISQHVLDSVSTTEMKIDALAKAGADTSELTKKVTDVQNNLKDEKFIDSATLAQEVADNAENAVLKLKAALKQKEHSETGKDVNEKMASLIELIKSGEEVNVNVKRTKALLTQARMSIKKNELEKAEDLLREAREDFLKELPKNLTSIISSSKPVLYKAKMGGVDIRPSIKLLKQASTALKLNNYLDALDAIKKYQSEMNQYME